MVQNKHMNNRRFTYLLMALSFFGVGCFGPADKNNETCTKSDYGIKEFNLYASRPIISNTYDLQLTIEQIGDCTKQAIVVSLYEDGHLSQQHEVSDLGQTKHITLPWTVKKDKNYDLKVNLEIMDDNLDNNQERINVTGMPLGNYLNISDLSADRVSSSTLLAEKLDLSGSLKISMAQIYIKSNNSATASGKVRLTLRQDNNGAPDKILAYSEVDLPSKEGYYWLQAPLNMYLDAGDYWLTVTAHGDGEFDWHYNRRQIDGWEDYLPRPKYKTDNKTLFKNKRGWTVMPEKNYTYKLHAQDPSE